jgi:hypothetical protein
MVETSALQIGTASMTRRPTLNVLHILEQPKSNRAIRSAPAWTADSQPMACMLNRNPRTIDRLVARGVIPCFRVGRALRFDPERVFKALARRALTTPLG